MQRAPDPQTPLGHVPAGFGAAQEEQFAAVGGGDRTSQMGSTRWSLGGVGDLGADRRRCARFKVAASRR